MAIEMGKNRCTKLEQNANESENPVASPNCYVVYSKQRDAKLRFGQPTVQALLRKAQETSDAMLGFAFDPCQWVMARM